MKIILAKSAGFCWGVKRAVEKARELSQKNNSVFTDGPLIHNEQMISQLNSENITETNDPASVDKAPLLIRAHGIPPTRRSMLNSLNINITDATCPDVAKIQGLIRKHIKQGYTIIIYGDKGHAEVIGLEGYAEGNSFIVTSSDDIKKIPISKQPICLVSQSTQLPLAYDEIINAVHQRFPNAVILDTICKSTKNRQQELLDISENVDAIVVVGGSHSANTVRLIELAKTIKPTFHIQTADQLQQKDFKDFEAIGLTAGASTPDFIINEVQARLESF
jgi:4-hydroxy-3-methylbut-2-enyl diphosphate reductase